MPRASQRYTTPRVRLTQFVPVDPPMSVEFYEPMDDGTHRVLNGTIKTKLIVEGEPDLTAYCIHTNQYFYFAPASWLVRPRDLVRWKRASPKRKPAPAMVVAPPSLVKRLRVAA